MASWKASSFCLLWKSIEHRWYDIALMELLLLSFFFLVDAVAEMGLWDPKSSFCSKYLSPLTKFLVQLQPGAGILCTYITLHRKNGICIPPSQCSPTCFVILNPVVHLFSQHYLFFNCPCFFDWQPLFPNLFRSAGGFLGLKKPTNYWKETTMAVSQWCS